MRRIARTILFLILISLIGAWWVLMTNLCDGPIKPDPLVGYTVPLKCHGARYITEAQDRWSFWLPIAISALLLVGMWGKRKDGP